jgi:holo-[acyl-carrier protein] synthase
MIYGIGTDIINIERVEQILNKNKDGFVHRVLSEHEQALFANKGDSAAYCSCHIFNAFKFSLLFSACGVGVMSSMQLNHGCTALLGGVNLVFLCINDEA